MKKKARVDVKCTAECRVETRARSIPVRVFTTNANKTFEDASFRHVLRRMLQSRRRRARFRVAGNRRLAVARRPSPGRGHTAQRVSFFPVCCSVASAISCFVNV